MMRGVPRVQGVQRPRRIAVVGGGMSGIAAAFYLGLAGESPEVIDAANSLGGRCATTRLGQHEITYGGKNIGSRYRFFRGFTAAMGHHPYEYFGINSSRVVDGELQVFDGTKKLKSFLGVARTLPPRDIARFAMMMLAVGSDEARRYLGTRYSEYLMGDSERLVSEVFSRTFCDSALRALTVRPNGAEPDELFLATFNANVGMLLDSYDQLVHGMGPVFDAFSARHDVLLGATVTGLNVESGKLTGVSVVDATGRTEHRHYDAVVLATPASVAADLLRPHEPELAVALDEVRYLGGAVVVAQYTRNIFSGELRAVAFDGHEVLSNAGVYGMRTRDIVRYTFSGRAARELLAGGIDGDGLIEAGERCLGRHIPVSADDRAGFVSQQWGHAYCAHRPRHPEFFRRVRGLPDRIEGLALTGDYLRGVSIESCFRASSDAVLRQLKTVAA